MKQNNSLKQYWTGYNAAKEMTYYCGLSTAKDEYTYGLDGKTNAYCKGYKAYLSKQRSK